MHGKKKPWFLCEILGKGFLYNDAACLEANGAIIQLLMPPTMSHSWPLHHQQDVKKCFPQQRFVGGHLHEPPSAFSCWRGYFGKVYHLPNIYGISSLPLQLYMLHLPKSNINWCEFILMEMTLPVSDWRKLILNTLLRLRTSDPSVFSWHWGCLLLSWDLPS